MAHWHRKASGRVYVYTRQDGKSVQVPKGNYAFLDAYSDEQVEQWVRQWEEQYEAKDLHPDSILYQGSELAQYIEAFTAYRRSRGIESKSASYQRALLNQYVLPFYLTQTPPLTKPSEWAPSAPRLLAYLEARKLGIGAIEHVNKALSAFWHWAQDEGLVLPGTVLRLRKPVREAAVTPLKHIYTPDEILSLCEAMREPSLRLITLLGYFFSIRPFEICALKPSDFKAGASAKALECCTVMGRYGLYDRFAVFIRCARNASGKEVRVKTAGSKAWVACFDGRAARLIVEAIKGIPPDEYLISGFLPEWHLKKWREEVRAEVKDLRRASLYWLGHHAALDVIPLRNHARHSKIETTMLYCRRPEAEEPAFEALDLDA